MTGRRTLRSSVRALALLLGLATASPAPARADEFDPKRLHQAIVAVYDRFFQDENPAARADEGVFADEGERKLARSSGLSAIDREALLQVLADEVAILGAPQYNAVVTLVLADYRRYPARRAGAQALLAQIRTAAAAKLPKPAKPGAGPASVLDAVVSDVTLAFGTYGLVRLGIGLAQARKSGLKGLAQFREVVARTSAALPLTRRRALALAGLGTAAGIAEAVYRHHAEKYLDPAAELRAVQADLARQHDRRLTALEKSLRDLNEIDSLGAEARRADAASIRAMVAATRRELDVIRRDLSHLVTAAPQERRRLELTAHTLREAEALLTRLGARG